MGLGGKVFFLIVIIFYPSFSFSHSGRTNSAGCHNDRSNGSFHCHGASYIAPDYTQKNNNKNTSASSSGSAYEEPEKQDVLTGFIFWCIILLFVYIILKWDRIKISRLLLQVQSANKSQLSHDRLHSMDSRFRVFLEKRINLYLNESLPLKVRVNEALDVSAIIYYFYSTLDQYQLHKNMIGNNDMSAWDAFLDTFSMALVDLISIDEFSTKEHVNRESVLFSSSCINYDIYDNKPADLDEFLTVIARTKLVNNPLTSSSHWQRSFYIEEVVGRCVRSVYGDDFFIERAKQVV